MYIPLVFIAHVTLIASFRWKYQEKKHFSCTFHLRWKIRYNKKLEKLLDEKKIWAEGNVQHSQTKFCQLLFILNLIFPLISIAFYHNSQILCELNCHDQKIWRTLVHDIQKHWTAVSTLLGLISSVYRDLYHRRSNQRPQNAEPKLYHWDISRHNTQVMPNQLVLLIAQLNVSCKLHPYSLQRTPSPPVTEINL